MFSPLSGRYFKLKWIAFNLLNEKKKEIHRKYDCSSNVAFYLRKMRNEDLQVRRDEDSQRNKKAAEIYAPIKI